MNNNNKHLHYLHDLSDYKVANADPDVRGWNVVDITGKVIGTVDNLLVSTDKMKVRYLDVEVDKNIIEEGHEPFADNDITGVHEFINRDGDTHLIIPIGLAKIDKTNEKVMSDEITRDTFAKTKRLQKDEPISPDYELYTLRSYRGTELIPASTKVNDSFYSREEFRNPSYI